MIAKRRSAGLLSDALFAGAFSAGFFLTPVPAAAQGVQTEKLQEEINAMQRQLRTLQAQLEETKKEAKAASHTADTAQQAVQKIPSAVYDVSSQSVASQSKGGLFKAPPSPSGVKLTFGGFVEGAGIWRERNEVADVNDSPFGSLPYPNSPLYHEDELRFSARQSRFSVMAVGAVDTWERLEAYYEMDFLGAGVTANSRESNSYQPRIRQAFLRYDNDNYHFHAVAGQAWSLVTPEKTGELPLDEDLPLVIDAQYVVGFNWARQPQFRFVEDWNKFAWLGVSVESPEVNFASNSIGAVGGPSQGGAVLGGSPAPPGVSINNLNACQASGLLDSATGCSTDEYPDVIEKLALDPGWGHYELLGLQRFFSDRVYETAIEGSGTNKTTVGWGVGGSVLLPVVPKLIDFQANALAGDGIGRYGSSQLADVTIGPSGTLVPLQTLQFMFGVVGHATPDLDIYGYAGQEEVNAHYYNIAGTPIG
jgi:hypothetical protein